VILLVFFDLYTDQWKGTRIGEVFFIVMVLLVTDVGFVFSKYKVEKGFYLKSTVLPSTAIISRSSIAP